MGDVLSEDKGEWFPGDELHCGGDGSGHRTENIRVIGEKHNLDAFSCCFCYGAFLLHPLGQRFTCYQNCVSTIPDSG